MLRLSTINLFGEQLTSGQFSGKWTVKILQAQPGNGTQELVQQAQQLGGVVTEQQQDEFPF